MITQKVIVNGFDRSGTSAICKTLSKHPEIELIMQPFNSGSIRKKMYEILSDKNVTTADRDFFFKLSRNILENSYIKSHWHHQHSTTREFVEGKLHVIKTTINHFSIKWVQEAFGEIPFYGIWRNPYDILASLLRNDFSEKWYSDAFEEIVPTLNEEETLAPYAAGIKRFSDPIIRTSVLIAARSHFFFHHLNPDCLIIYEHFRDDADRALSKFLSDFSLSPFSFSSFVNEDYNIIGKKFQGERNYRSTIPVDLIPALEEIFAPLDLLMRTKFGNHQWLDNSLA